MNNKPNYGSFIYLFARYISYVFVPPSFTFLIFLYVGLTGSYETDMKFKIILSGLLLGLIFPIIYFTYLMKKGRVGDTDATIKEERFLPYIFGVFISSVGLLLSYVLYLPKIISGIWFIYLLNMLLLLLINKYWKISAHAIGASLTIGILFQINNLWSLIILPLLIIIGWSRIYLGKHTLLQVITGAIFGFTLSVVTLNLFL